MSSSTSFSWREFALVLSAYIGLTCIYFFPILGDLDAIWSAGRDFYQNNWNFWWVKHAYDAGIPFYENNTLFHPTGTSLAFHTISYANTMPALALQLLLGTAPLVLHNTFFLLTFPLSALGAWALARHLTGSPWGAFAAGVLFSFNPYHIAMITQVNNAQFQWIPLFLLFVLLLYRDGRYWQMVVAGLILAAAGYTDWYQPIFAVLGGGVVLAVKLTADRRWLDGSFWARIFGMGLLAALLMFPGVRPLFAIMQETGGGELENSFRFVGAMQLLGVKPQGSPFYHFWPVFFGWSTCLLLLRTALRTRSKGVSAFWWLAGLSFLFLQGPYLVALNIHFPEIPLPLALFAKIPVLDLLRVPHRFLLLLLLGLSMLLAWGLQDWFLKRGKWTVLLFIPILALELRPHPIQAVDRQPASIYESMAQDTDDYAVLELPMDYRDAYSMFLQRTHKKKLIAGYTSHILPSALPHLQTDLMRALHPAQTDTDITGLPEFLPVDVDTLSESVVQNWKQELLQEKGVRVIVFHRGVDFEPPHIEIPEVSLRFKMLVSLTPYCWNSFANRMGLFQQMGVARFQEGLAMESKQARQIIGRLFGPPHSVDGATEVWDLR